MIQNDFHKKHVKHQIVSIILQMEILLDQMNEKYSSISFWEQFLQKKKNPIHSKRVEQKKDHVFSSTLLKINNKKIYLHTHL